MREKLGTCADVVDSRQETDNIFRIKLGLDPVDRFIHARGFVHSPAREAVNHVVSERLAGVPLAYLLGRADFDGNSFIVTRDVLIPRQDTEFLLRRGDWFIRDQIKTRYNLRLLDLGSGSGCVGISMALRHPRLEVVFIDLSPAALDVARRNARLHGVEQRCRFLEGDWFAPLERRERFDLILCNPPYITRRNDPLLEKSVRDHEPRLALFLNEDPKEFFFRLGRSATGHLHSGGLFAVEVGYDTGWPAREALEKIKALDRVQGVHDFNGTERVIWGLRR